jgi:uncharacterized protein YwgA
MKCLYFLKTVGKLNLEVEFNLHTWGPFAAEVLSARDRLSESGQIAEICPTGDDGFDLSISDGAKSGVTFDDSQEAILKELVEKSASELEAISTLHYVSASIGKKSKEEVINRVKRIKPYFTMAELERYWEWLSAKGWV